MNRWLLLLLVVGAGTLSAAAAPDPRQALKDGERAFVRTNFTESARLFSVAAEQAGPAHLDAAVPYYNRGVALLKQGQLAPAAEQFQTAARTSDLDLQQKALFNRGNALVQLADELEKGSQSEEALKAVEEALAMYEQAMTLRPRDRDPKVNYELATRQKERLEKLVQQQQQQPSSSSQDQKKKQGEDKQNQPSPQKPPGEKPPPPDEQKNQDGNQQQEQDQPQRLPEPSSEDNHPEDQQGKNEQPPPAGQEMTREEAARLLDGMKQQEQAQREQMSRDRMRMNMGRLPPVEKDW